MRTQLQESCDSVVVDLISMEWPFLSNLGLPIWTSAKIKQIIYRTVLSEFKQRVEIVVDDDGSLPPKEVSSSSMLASHCSVECFSSFAFLQRPLLTLEISDLKSHIS